MAAQPLMKQMDDRAEPRDEVYHRTRVTLADQRSAPIIVVNLSPHGMMARVEVEVAAGERLTLTLPVIGSVGAAVRWSLGGRIGCRFDRPIDGRDYGRLLSVIGA